MTASLKFLIFSIWSATGALALATRGRSNYPGCDISPESYEWQNLPDIPVPWQEESVAAANGKVYIIGGITSNVSHTPADPDPPSTVVTLSATKCYDTRTREWTDAAAAPVKINHGNAATIDGKIYLLGGLSGSNLSEWNGLPNSYVYDPDTDKWTELESMPSDTARGGSAVGVWQSKVFLAGGLNTLQLRAGGLQNSVTTVTSYDTKTNKWDTSLPPIPGARDHVGGAVINDTFFVIGGRDHGQYNTRNNTWALNLLDPSSGWVEKAEMPTARGGLMATAVGQYIFAFGGEGDPTEVNMVFNETQVYDTVADSWTRLPPMSIPRHGTQAVTIGEVIYIPGGGVMISNAPTAAFTAFHPSWHGW